MCSQGLLIDFSINTPSGRFNLASQYCGRTYTMNMKASNNSMKKSLKGTKQRMDTRTFPSH